MHVKDFYKTSIKQSNNSIRLDTRINNHANNGRRRISMNKLLTLFTLSILSTNVVADKLVFSQYDGINSWDNTYIYVPDAKQYPGAFHDGIRPAQSGGKPHRTHRLRYR